MQPRFRNPALAVALVAGLAVACSGDAPEEQLAEAQSALEEARSELESERARVAEEREELEACRRDLSQAREDLEEAQREVASAESRRNERATDVAIFRAVQAELLAAEALEHAAIRAEVTDRVVTLEGRAQSVEARGRAEEIAQGVAGVEQVDNRIEVVEADAE